MEVVMRKVIQSVLVSADGVVSDPGQWALDYRDAGVEKDTLHRLGDIGSMLLGRGTYQLFAATWPGQTSDFAARMNSMRKYVFSSSLDRAGWANSTLVRGDAVTEVTRLREQDGPDLVLYGHGRLAQALREHGLIDEFRLAIHPVLAGRGQLLFQAGGKTPLILIGAETLGTGIVVLSYRPASP
jgi:dihydrofolate reductase